MTKSQEVCHCFLEHGVRLNDRNLIELLVYLLLVLLLHLEMSLLDRNESELVLKSSYVFGELPTATARHQIDTRLDESVRGHLLCGPRATESGRR